MSAVVRRGKQRSGCGCVYQVGSAGGAASRPDTGPYLIGARASWHHQLPFLVLVWSALYFFSSLVSNQGVL